MSQAEVRRLGKREKRRVARLAAANVLELWLMDGGAVKDYDDEDFTPEVWRIIDRLRAEKKKVAEPTTTSDPAIAPVVEPGPKLPSGPGSAADGGKHPLVRQHPVAPRRLVNEANDYEDRKT